jgi:hypothetical protein
MSVKVPAPTIPVPNPLHQFASYTYALSLWWLDTDDYNALSSCKDVGSAMTQPIPKSYVLAEDSGLYPDRRLPGTGGLNYYLSDAKIVTHVQPSTLSGQTNMLQCSFTVTEPYGSTLLDVLVASSLEQNGGSYIDQKYILQIDFFGYDDAGNQIPTSQTELYRKRYPIKISEMKVKVGIEGSSYRCKAYPVSFEAYNAINCKLPVPINVTASTFKELLDKVAQDYNKFFANDVALGHRQLASTLAFDIDKDIGNSKITNSATMPLSQVPPGAQDAALGQAPFRYAAGTDINDIIQKAFAQTEFFVSEQLGFGYNKVKQETANLGTIVNTYKTTCQSLVQGVAGNGAVVTGKNAKDVATGKESYGFTFKIHQYATFGASHTLDTGQFSDARPYVTKLYKYVYTGENTDILRLDIDLNLKYYTAILAYSNNIGAAQVTAQSKNQNLAQYVPSSGYALTPSFLINTILPQFKSTRVIAPTRIETIVQDMSVSQGLRGQVDAIIGMDVLRSKQTTPADMLTVKLDIVGDPTLLKQDDWLYSPSPLTSNTYNSWDSMSQYEFSLKYGHLRMDIMPVVVGLQINTPIDADTEYLNTGLVFPPMSRNGTSSSLFSGLYTTTTIESTFSKGRFTQLLNLVRVINQEYNEKAEIDIGNSAVRQNQTNLRKSQ